MELYVVFTCYMTGFCLSIHIELLVLYIALLYHLERQILASQTNIVRDFE